MENNPYSAPTSDLTVTTEDMISDNFQRFSAWWVFLLTIITLGIYPIYWTFTRAQTANRIHENQIASAWLAAMVALYALTFLAEYAFPEMEGIFLLANIGYLVAYLTCLFKVKNRLQDLMSKSTGSTYTLSPILTFFFNSIYLQYKINEFIDLNQPSADHQTAA